MKQYIPYLLGSVLGFFGSYQVNLMFDMTSRDAARQAVVTSLLSFAGLAFWQYYINGKREMKDD